MQFLRERVGTLMNVILAIYLGASAGALLTGAVHHPACSITLALVGGVVLLGWWRVHIRDRNGVNP